MQCAHWRLPPQPSQGSAGCPDRTRELPQPRGRAERTPGAGGVGPARASHLPVPSREKSDWITRNGIASRWIRVDWGCWRTSGLSPPTLLSWPPPDGLTSGITGAPPPGRGPYAPNELLPRPHGDTRHWPGITVRRGHWPGPTGGAPRRQPVYLLGEPGGRDPTGTGWGAGTPTVCTSRPSKVVYCCPTKTGGSPRPEGQAGLDGLSAHPPASSLGTTTRRGRTAPGIRYSGSKQATALATGGKAGSACVHSRPGYPWSKQATALASGVKAVCRTRWHYESQKTRPTPSEGDATPRGLRHAGKRHSATRRRQTRRRRLP